MELAQREADQEVKAQLEELRQELAKKQTELDEKEREIVEKDRALLVLVEEKQDFRRELISDLEEALKTLSDVSEQVLDLTNDFRKFQKRAFLNREETSTAGTSLKRKMPARNYASFAAAKDDVSKNIANAQSELSQAAKAWNKAQSGLEVMEDFNRKRIMAAVLGKEGWM